MFCRLCLKSNTTLRNIVTSDLKCAELTLIESLYWIFGVDIDVNDNYSKLICVRCENVVEYVGNYRTFYQNNQLILEEKLDYQSEGDEWLHQPENLDIKTGFEVTRKRKLRKDKFLDVPEKNTDTKDVAEIIDEDEQHTSQRLSSGVSPEAKRRRLKFIEYYYRTSTSAIRELIKDKASETMDQNSNKMVMVKINSEENDELFRVNEEVQVMVCKFCSQIYKTRQQLDFHCENKHKFQESENTTRAIRGKHRKCKRRFSRIKSHVPKKDTETLKPDTFTRKAEQERLALNKILDPARIRKHTKEFLFDLKKLPNLNIINQLHMHYEKVVHSKQADEIKTVAVDDNCVSIKNINNRYKWLKLKDFDIFLEKCHVPVEFLRKREVVTENLHKTNNKENPKEDISTKTLLHFSGLLKCLKNSETPPCEQHKTVTATKINSIKSATATKSTDLPGEQDKAFTKMLKMKDISATLLKVQQFRQDEQVKEKLVRSKSVHERNGKLIAMQKSKCHIIKTLEKIQEVKKIEEMKQRKEKLEKTEVPKIAIKNCETKNGGIENSKDVLDVNGKAEEKLDAHFSENEIISDFEDADTGDGTVIDTSDDENVIGKATYLKKTVEPFTATLDSKDNFIVNVSVNTNNLLEKSQIDQHRWLNLKDFIIPVERCAVSEEHYQGDYMDETNLNSFEMDDLANAKEEREVLENSKTNDGDHTSDMGSWKEHIKANLLRLKKIRGSVLARQGVKILNEEMGKTEDDLSSSTRFTNRYLESNKKVSAQMEIKNSEQEIKSVTMSYDYLLGKEQSVSENIKELLNLKDFCISVAKCAVPTHYHLNSVMEENLENYEANTVEKRIDETEENNSFKGYTTEVVTPNNTKECGVETNDNSKKPQNRSENCENEVKTIILNSNYHILGKEGNMLRNLNNQYKWLDLKDVCISVKRWTVPRPFDKQDRDNSELVTNENLPIDNNSYRNTVIKYVEKPTAQYRETVKAGDFVENLAMEIENSDNENGHDMEYQDINEDFYKADGDVPINSRYEETMGTISDDYHSNGVKSIINSSESYYKKFNLKNVCIFLERCSVPNDKAEEAKTSDAKVETKGHGSNDIVNKQKEMKKWKNDISNALLKLQQTRMIALEDRASKILDGTVIGKKETSTNNDIDHIIADEVTDKRLETVGAIIDEYNNPECNRVAYIKLANNKTVQSCGRSEDRNAEVFQDVQHQEKEQSFDEGTKASTVIENYLKPEDAKSADRIIEMQKRREQISATLLKIQRIKQNKMVQERLEHLETITVEKEQQTQRESLGESPVGKTNIEGRKRKKRRKKVEGDNINLNRCYALQKNVSALNTDHVLIEEESINVVSDTKKVSSASQRTENVLHVEIGKKSSKKKISKESLKLEPEVNGLRSYVPDELIIHNDSQQLSPGSTPSDIDQISNSQSEEGVKKISSNEQVVNSLELHMSNELSSHNDSETSKINTISNVTPVTEKEVKKTSCKEKMSIESVGLEINSLGSNVSNKAVIPNDSQATKPRNTSSTEVGINKSSSFIIRKEKEVKENSFLEEPVNSLESDKSNELSTHSDSDTPKAPENGCLVSSDIDTICSLMSLNENKIGKKPFKKTISEESIELEHEVSGLRSDVSDELVIPNDLQQIPPDSNLTSEEQVKKISSVEQLVNSLVLYMSNELSSHNDLDTSKPSEKKSLVNLEIDTASSVTPEKENEVEKKSSKKKVFEEAVNLEVNGLQSDVSDELVISNDSQQITSDSTHSDEDKTSNFKSEEDINKSSLEDIVNNLESDILNRLSTLHDSDTSIAPEKGTLINSKIDTICSITPQKENEVEKKSSKQKISEESVKLELKVNALRSDELVILNNSQSQQITPGSTHSDMYQISNLTSQKEEDDKKHSSVEVVNNLDSNISNEVLTPNDSDTPKAVKKNKRKKPKSEISNVQPNSSNFSEKFEIGQEERVPSMDTMSGMKCLDLEQSMHQAKLKKTQYLKNLKSSRPRRKSLSKTKVEKEERLAREVDQLSRLLGLLKIIENKGVSCVKSDVSNIPLEEGDANSCKLVAAGGDETKNNEAIDDNRQGIVEKVDESCKRKNAGNNSTSYSSNVEEISKTKWRDNLSATLLKIRRIKERVEMNKISKTALIEGNGLHGESFDKTVTMCNRNKDTEGVTQLRSAETSNFFSEEQNNTKVSVENEDHIKNIQDSIKQENVSEILIPDRVKHIALNKEHCRGNEKTLEVASLVGVRKINLWKDQIKIKLKKNDT